jgi:hypothetical protein
MCYNLYVYVCVLKRTPGYFAKIRKNFFRFLRRPDDKNALVQAFQQDYNKIHQDLRQDVSAKEEFHQVRVCMYWCSCVYMCTYLFTSISNQSLSHFRTSTHTHTHTHIRTHSGAMSSPTSSGTLP